MNNTGKDHLGQEVQVGDWAAMTQNNTIYAGKIIKISAKGNPTVARNSVEEFISKDKKFKNAPWRERNQIIENRFGKGHSYWSAPDWCRDNKFVKIEPTNQMIRDYDVVKTV